MKILFLSHRLPYAPNRGDRVRALHILKELSPWAEIDIASLVHDADEAGHAGDLAHLARKVVVTRVPKARNIVRAVAALPTSAPTTHSMLDAPEWTAAVEALIAERRPDLVFCYCTGVAPILFHGALSGIPAVLDMVDVDSAKWSSLAETARFPLSWIYAREARVLGRFEVEAVRRAAVTFVVNSRERDTLTAMVPGAPIEVLSNGIDLDTLRPPSDRVIEKVVVFVGVMNYEPNVQGVEWLVRYVWPIVRKAVPDARLELVGAHPSRAVLALHNPALGITVTGSVPDVRPYLWHAMLAVAPLQTARGVQNKVLEAVAAGLRVVVTPAVMDGLPEPVRGACVQAETPDAFAERIIEGLTPGQNLATIATDALHELSWERQLEKLRGRLRDAATAKLPVGTGRNPA